VGATSALTGQNWAREPKLQQKVNLGGLKRVFFYRVKITTLKNLGGQKCN